MEDIDTPELLDITSFTSERRKEKKAQARAPGATADTVPGTRSPVSQNEYADGEFSIILNECS